MVRKIKKDSEVKTAEVQEQVQEQEQVQAPAVIEPEPKHEVKAAEIKKVPASITIQHIGRMRQWTLPAIQVVKVHNGRIGRNDSPRFKKNVTLLPGVIVDVIPEVAKRLIRSKDFQKYGVDTK